MRATEQKTIFEELLEDAPVQLEHKRKLAQVRHMISKEEWDTAASLLDDILLMYPEDPEVPALRKLIEEKKQKAEERLREREEERKEAERVRKLIEEKTRKPRAILGSKKFIITALVVLLIIAVAVAAIVGIINHRQELQELYGDTPVSTEETAYNSINITDVYSVRFIFAAHLK